MRKILYILFLCFLLAVSVCSCDSDLFSGGEGSLEEEGGKTEENENEVEGGESFVWNSGTELYVVGAIAEFDKAEFSDDYGLAVSEIFNKLSLNTEARVELINDASEKKPHEIVVGYAERDISQKAYALLEKIKTDGDDDITPRYLIYSDGSSVAIAFDTIEENYAMRGAVDYFCEELIDESLKLPTGTVTYEYYSMNEIHEERDEEILANSWKNYRETVVKVMTPSLGSAEAQSYADSLISELEKIYAMYSDELVDWFAGLYEPYICICDGECKHTRYCGGAGFYYSNSARDNRSVVHNGKEYLLLPDAETTAQVLGFIGRSGMLELKNGDYFSAFPEGEPERIIRFIKSLQDENSGYFYHPQWLSMLGTADFWDSRQSRDMTYSLSTLSAFGASPTYDTPTGTKGDGILYDGTGIGSNIALSGLTLPLRQSRINAVSRVLLTGSVHPRLESKESFSSYLATLNLAGNSYYVGNELSSLAPQIVARDKEIGTAEDPRPLATILDAWLRENQDTSTGYWHKTSSGSVYYPINGLLKIVTLYNTLELPFPNPLAAARSAFSVITSEEKIEHVCDLYNTWFAVSCIVRNLSQFSGDEALGKEIISDVRVDAIPAVRATAQKMKAHQKQDGSFSYFERRSSSTSQNAPVAIPNTDEGDVNATVIFTYGILDYMFDSLGFGGMRKFFTDCDRERFVDIIEEKIAASEKRS